MSFLHCCALSQTLMRVVIACSEQTEC